MTPTAVLRRTKRGDITVHGFRSTFRDWAGEEAHGFQNETIKLALAHTIKNQAEAAYRRGDQLEKRCVLIDTWAQYVETKQEKRTGKVIALKAKNHGSR